MMGEHRKAYVAECAAINGGLSTAELEGEMYEIMKFRYEFWKWIEQFNYEKIDVILSPVTYFPALPIGFSKYFATSLTSTFLQNVLDCAAGSVGPITFVNKDECGYDIDELPMDQRDSMAKKLDEYMKGAEGLPVNVQVFGRPYDDEIVLRVMNELETLFMKESK